MYEEVEADTKHEAMEIMWGIIRNKFPDTELWPGEIIKIKDNTER